MSDSQSDGVFGWCGSTGCLAAFVVFGVFLHEDEIPLGVPAELQQRINLVPPTRPFRLKEYDNNNLGAEIIKDGPSLRFQRRADQHVIVAVKGGLEVLLEGVELVGPAPEH